MNTRREFIKKSMLLSGAAGLSNFLPESIQRAMAINPAPGSTYLDAEHVVFLMQENRSFDHCFGALRGVRGFNDPRAFKLANGYPVWCQTDAAGKTYSPFRLNLNDTKVTWMGSLPHGRTDQVDANNNGEYDQWLKAKSPRDPKYKHMPLTLGYYNREDLPFNYAMADAFTVCDQSFCSAMTSTWPNRLFFWTGTIRNAKTGFGHIRNDLKPGEETYKTFPERLEENNISWCVYQNDLSSGGGYVGEERSWLANFGCNPLEWFEKYNVKFSARYVKGLKAQADKLHSEIAVINRKLGEVAPASAAFSKLNKDLTIKKEVLATAEHDLQMWNEHSFNKLSQQDKNLHQKAFTKNVLDPNHNQLDQLDYNDGQVQRKVTVPKGDLFYQFRKDVNEGKLSTVSWLTPPQNYSDHPSAPWYGSWYVSEILDILTKNPEVWKKTIFVVTYDENDGYFDHIPPFLPPDLSKKDTGACSKGIETESEFIRMNHELAKGISKKQAREAAIGLGYRVPMIIASPWSRGGQVCSEVFDHTSSLQFLEGFINKKFNKNIREENISTWRRTICGDLTSAFKPFDGKKLEDLPFLNRDKYIEKIYSAQFKQDPSGFKEVRNKDFSQNLQEEGVRTSCALPYELYFDGNLGADGKSFEVKMTAGDKLFGQLAAGCPFNVYAPTILKNWRYAVSAGDTLNAAWPLSKFDIGNYFIKAHGPNGFYREFAGNAQDPKLLINCKYEIVNGKATGNISIHLTNLSAQEGLTLEITDHAYGAIPITKILKRNKISETPSAEILVLNLKNSFGWYDFSIKVKGNSVFEKRYAGHVETGKESVSDPYMGKLKG
jgi:phospholipase C